MHTTANTRSAYWLLVSAIANVDARTVTLGLSQELARVNKAKVDVGQSPPLDLVSAQAEVAANEEQLIIAQTLVRQAEDRLRLLIFDPTDLSIWNQTIEPIDSPPIAQVSLDVDAAVTAGARRPDRHRPVEEGHRERRRQREIRREPEAARRAPERQLRGQRPRRHPGAAHRGLSRARSSGPGRSPITGPC